MDQHPCQERIWNAYEEQAYGGRDETWKTGYRL